MAKDMLMGGEWYVELSNQARKQIKKLPVRVGDIVAALLKELENGPIQASWPNYSTLGRNIYHCHLKKGRPTYVACWHVIDKQEKKIEVYYVGTHENAPY